MPPLSQVDLEPGDTTPVWSSVLDVYDVDLDAEWEWDPSDIPLSGEIDVRSSLLVDFALIRDKCVEFSVEGPATADGVFKLAVRGLNTFGEQSEIMTCGDRLHRIIQ